MCGDEAECTVSGHGASGCLRDISKGLLLTGHCCPDAPADDPHASVAGTKPAEEGVWRDNCCRRTSICFCRSRLSSTASQRIKSYPCCKTSIKSLVTCPSPSESSCFSKSRSFRFMSRRRRLTVESGLSALSGLGSLPLPALDGGAGWQRPSGANTARHPRH